ncbi:hypothetical protein CRENBAI_018083 [Crenichthys baileyi]|uniref:Uncharacterized protein n=1 Tax=Crenichthys baileyi TaxID=28760 RepID=A0AAV9RJ12_9TELE
MENHSPVVTCLSTLLRGNAQTETSSYTRERREKTADDRTHPANLLHRGRTYLPSETTIILAISPYINPPERNTFQYSWDINNPVAFLSREEPVPCCRCLDSCLASVHSLHKIILLKRYPEFVVVFSLELRETLHYDNFMSSYRFY